MRRVLDILRLYSTGMRIGLAENLAYRGNFLIRFFVMLLSDLLFPLVTLLVYGSGAAFPGWTLEEVLLIQGVFMIAKGFAYLFFFGLVWNIGEMVREGLFDLLLIKPCSVIHLAAATSFSMENSGSLLGGIGIFIYAVSKIPKPGPWEWAAFFLLFLFALSVLFSFSLFMSGTLFKWVGNSRIYEIFSTITQFGLFPKTIYSRAFQNLLTYLMPIMMIAFFPAAVLKGDKPEGLYLSAAVCLVFLFTARLFWHAMLKSYSSAGG